MSATKDHNSTAAVTNSNQQFSSKIAPTGGVQTTGHAPGTLTSEADKAPEFSAKIIPAGTAPASKTFQPQNDAIDPESVRQDAQDTITGATSEEVGAGVIPGGQTSNELAHDGQKHRKHERGGLEGVGAAGLGKLEKERAQ
ncbi:hypothetical protein FKW77_006613 [Venturia effusa]|uniref:Uncharacterized protein n=1 Tax=Venturia effusa TaxID=50376 RepID=A0A517LPA4_9PEZI|nr:hypothetical protein FKW77_006613 [Venturia effusa]